MSDVYTEVVYDGEDSNAYLQHVNSNECAGASRHRLTEILDERNFILVVHQQL